MTLLYIIIGAAAGLISGAALMFLISRKNEERLRNEKESVITQSTSALASLDKEKSIAADRLIQSEKTISELEASLNAEREKTNLLNASLSRTEAEKSSLIEKLETRNKEMEDVQKKLITEFENLANRILKQNTVDFTATNQKNIDDLLKPLKEKLGTFEKMVSDTYEKGLKDQTDLKAELKKLNDLNTRLSEEAHNLTHALKGDVKKQGNWGEMVLERVLERSGLTRGREFEMQVSTTNAEGSRIQPDVVIYLPDKKHLIVDSKVSLVAYEKYVNATTDEERVQHIKEHVLSIKSHIRGLSEKHYQTSPDLNTPDFVLLFVAIESSFSIAIQTDQDLFNFAWDNKVVMVSPSTLLATLRTIESMWKQEYHARNARDIARKSGEMLDKFTGFLEDLEKIGKGLDSAKDNWTNAVNKLSSGRGNLINRARGLKELGVTMKKGLPEKFMNAGDEHDDNDEE